MKLKKLLMKLKNIPLNTAEGFDNVGLLGKADM